MSVFKFAVVLNLSNYFSDHRHRARICIDERIKTVKDLQDKITTIFGVKNFILTSRNEYLPHTEDIRILHSDDIIWVIPSNNAHPPEDNTVNTSAYITSKVDKKKKSSILNNREDNHIERNVFEEKVNDELQINVEKRKKKHSIDISKIKKDKEHKKKHKDYEGDAEESQGVLKRKLKSLDYTQEKTKDSILKNGSCPVENPYVNPDKKHKKKRKDYESDAGESQNVLKRTLKSSDYTQEKTKDSILKNASCPVENPYVNPDIKHKKKRKDYESDAGEYQNVLKRKLKSPDYTQEKTKDSILKNGSCPVENPYVNPDPIINVATSSPFSIPCKKAALVSTNTNKYIEENKINIVKIDYIRRPTSELKHNGEADGTTCQTQMEVVEEAKSLENNVVDLLISESSASNKDNPSNTEVVEESLSKQIDPFFDYQKTNKISLYVPTTKYFFLNTPSNENRVKTKPAKKRENFFKLKEGLFSPVANKNNTVDDVEQVDLNKNETSIDSTSQISIDNTKMSQEENEHDQQILDVATTEVDKKSDADISVVITEPSGNKEVFGKLTRSILEDSCYIDKISPCNNTLLDNSEINYDTSSISGVIPFSFSSTKKRYVSGVGQLLTSLRESETNSTLDRELNSDSSEFVTKRRHRTRKRQKKTNNSVEETTTFKPTPQVTGTIKSFTAPKMHIKFSENLEKDNSEVTEHTKEYSGYNETTNICNKTDCNKNESSTDCIVNGSDYMKSLEESVHQLPIMSQTLPKIGDVISFKVLKISDDFTPGISSRIVGNVIQFSPESKVVTFKITTGIEQLQAPKGKFSLDQEDDHNSSSDIKDILWTELIEPKLLYP